MKAVLERLDKIKDVLSNKFIANESDPEVARKKHIRLGVVICAISVIVAYFILSSTDIKQVNANTLKDVKQQSKAKTIDIEELAKGASNERIWIEEAEKELEAVKQTQLLNQSNQNKLNEDIQKDKVSKEELEDIISRTVSDLEEKYERKLQERLAQINNEVQQEKINSTNIEVNSFKPKKKIKKVGDYIPAGSYTSAKMLSGVDAGIGMSAEADPRQVLMRITAPTVSAGNKVNDQISFISTNRLIGCLLQCQAVGDISSEKAYLKPVVMTCAKDASSIIEVPVKGYITSKGKVGIRGEIVSREGDLVLKSFLSGIVGGFGSGLNQLSQTPMNVSSNGLIATEPSKLKNIAMQGLGNGVGNSSDRLSDYFIKRAEQYQPVISINEGAEVEVVFQEGFSLKEEEEENVKNKK